MSFRIATFNVENMFERPKALNQPDWADGKDILADYAALTNLTQKATYSAADKKKLLDIMAKHKGLLTQSESKFIMLREYRGKLVKRPKGAPAEIAVDGRDEWVGWFELVSDKVNAAALLNTARIVRELAADILAVVEADNRIALMRFNQDALLNVQATPYAHVMLIDGNDERGIDLGIMTTSTYPIEAMHSRVYDRDTKGVIFSRDCVEYHVRLPSGELLVLLLNHFKSKGYGNQTDNDAKRLRQAKRVRQIYDDHIASGQKLVAVLGDFNDTPDRAPLKPLLASGSTLKDVMVHPKFVADGREGTHGNGTKSSKLDYILLSPALWSRVGKAGIERRGVWGGKNGTLFPHLPEITKKIEAASDHAALWVDIN